MSYDFEDPSDTSPPRFLPKGPDLDPKDQQVLKDLLTIAAILLTPTRESRFTLEDLIEKALLFGGEGFTIEQSDIRSLLEAGLFEELLNDFCS